MRNITIFWLWEWRTMLAIMMSKGVSPRYTIHFPMNWMVTKNTRRPMDTKIGTHNQVTRHMMSCSLEMTTQHPTTKIWKYFKDGGNCVVECIVCERWNRASGRGKGPSDGPICLLYICVDRMPWLSQARFEYPMSNCPGGTMEYWSNVRWPPEIQCFGQKIGVELDPWASRTPSHNTMGNNQRGAIW